MEPKSEYHVNVKPDGRGRTYSRLYLPPYLSAKYGLDKECVVLVSENDDQTAITIKKLELNYDTKQQQQRIDQKNEEGNF